MLSARWLSKRKPLWQRLSNLIERSGGRGVSALSHEELQQLGLLYRQIAADLSAAREDPASESLARYLNQLLGRAHNLIYAGRRASGGGVTGFYARTLPRVFRETLPYTVAALAVFLCASVLGFLLVLNDAAFPRYLLGPGMMDTIEKRQMWTHSIVAIKPLASSGIMTNNIAVAFVTFAWGITAGIGTLYLLFLNGLLLGTITAACWEAGMTLRLYDFVAAHGIIEIPAILIAGGAGLLIARGMLFPGLLPRRDSLARAGSQAAQLLLGVIPMLVVAGLIEGYISPTTIPSYLKVLLAAALGSLLAVYFGLAGRKQES